MPLDKEETFAFLKVCSEAGLLEPLMAAIGTASWESSDDAQGQREPGTRFLEDANLALAKVNLDELNELMESAGPLIKYLSSEPEVVRQIVGTRIVQRKLGRLAR